MIGQIPIVTFDTSAHNRLVKDGTKSGPIMAGIESGLWFRFAGLSVEELFAHPQRRDREALFYCCRRLQRGPSDCLLPSNLLIERLIVAHFNDTRRFNWKTVNVKWNDCERAIRNPEFLVDERVSVDQRQLQSERNKLGKREFLALRSELQAIFEKHGEPRPADFRTAISRLENSTNSSVYAMAQRYYDLATKKNSDEATVKQFMDACPPFRSLIYARFIPWYNQAVRDYPAGEKLSAGSNDLFMSVYLPYCDKFVTAEINGQQQKCLREIAAVAGLETEVLSYDDFRESFLVNV